ncbi:hypothetical protein J6590_014667 [Homalodisca vitripennis]|nr:hypothetical protein J6590_014667 [Homalodisca vitripennis]
MHVILKCLKTSDKDPTYFRNPDNLSINEIDRYALYDSQSDEYSGEFNNTTLENSSVLDITETEPSNNNIAVPGPSHVNTLPSANPTSRRGKKAPRYLCRVQTCIQNIFW